MIANARMYGKLNQPWPERSKNCEKHRQKKRQVHFFSVRSSNVKDALQQVDVKYLFGGSGIAHFHRVNQRAIYIDSIFLLYALMNIAPKFL